MSHADRQRWDARYSEGEKWQHERSPYPLLVEHVRRLPDGLALDLACGLGHNTIWLAEQGYRAIGVDVSRVALRRARQAAEQRGLTHRLLFVEADLDHFRPPPAHFDLVCVIRFLNRDLLPAIRAALKPGGLLIYATLNWRWIETHPDTPRDLLLKPGELSAVFGDWISLAESEAGDHSYLVARKPSAT